MADQRVVLVIDDEPFIIDMITTYMQLKGYQVRGATNGTDGLALLPLEKPDALLLDLMLPDIQGFEICERIRAMPDFADLPILIISARTDADSKARAERAGASAYLVKPIKMAELFGELERLFKTTPQV